MSPLPLRPAAPGLADVQRIAALAEPALRNRAITQCYHELARAYAGRAPGCANWCAFATWASRQAGQTIRGEDLADALEHALDASPALDLAAERAVRIARELGGLPTVAELKAALRTSLRPVDVVQRTSDAVAQGNLLVFAEIGLQFARYLAERGSDDAFDAAAIAGFCAGLRGGDPPDGQGHLRRAFERFYRAQFEPDPARRSELLLFANLEVGLHEQIRLQPKIREALDAAVPTPAELHARLSALLVPRAAGAIARVRRFVHGLWGGRSPLDEALAPLVETLRREVRRAITEHLMTLTLARDVRLRLGSDLTAAYPPSLAHIESAELSDFLRRIDPTPDSTRASGASDWGDLVERMHFIAELFRCFHEDASLFDAPFAAERPSALA